MTSIRKFGDSHLISALSFVPNQYIAAAEIRLLSPKFPSPNFLLCRDGSGASRSGDIYGPVPFAKTLVDGDGELIAPIYPVMR